MLNIKAFDDSYLLKDIQNGKNVFDSGSRNVINIDLIFGETTPYNITQNSFTGENDIYRASLGRFGIPYQIKNYDQE